jgi:oligoendopeptidase F
MNYATSLTAAYALVEPIVCGGVSSRKAVDKFTGLLKSGGSDAAHTLLCEAGVDLCSNAPYRAILKRYGEIFDELEAAFAASETVS